MKMWKKYLSVVMSAALLSSVFVIPKSANAADAGTMLTDEDLSDTAVDEPEAWGVTPNEEQLHYMKDSLAAFCHFGPNTFNGVEWGESYGTRRPADIFTLNTDFDADTIVKAVKDAGFGRLMLTAKHHDGFCLWASDYTTYDIASTNYKGGKGDILEEISDACTKYNVDMGCYLSPWDIHEDHYGCFGDNNSNANSAGITDYNELYKNCIREICTATKKDANGNTITDANGNPVYKYGNNNPNRRSDRFVEWWMDGAQGEGVHRQKYDWVGIIGEIRKENPHCQIFGTGGAIDGKNGEADRALASTGGIHWIGNENGFAADETWAKLTKGQDLNKVGDYVNGVAEGDQWSVPECDTKMLKNGWFWSSTKQNSLHSMESLANIYFRSVGHGATLLLNLSPNSEGKIDTNQLNRLKEFGETIKNSFDEDLTKAEGVTASATSVWKNSRDYSASKVLDEIPEGEAYDNTYWAPAEGETTGTLEIDFGGVRTFDAVSIEEYIQKGQSISSFSVEYKSVTGRWEEFGKGATISSKRLLRGNEVEATALRVNILSAYSTPMITNVGAYKLDEKFEAEDSNVVKLPENLKSIPVKEFTTSENGNNTWTFENNDTSAWSNAAKNGVASFSFTGTKFWLKGTMDPNHGKMDIYVDDVKIDNVNTYASTRNMDALIYTSPELEYKEHTVRLVCVEAAIGLSEALYHDGTGIFEMKQGEYEVAEGGTVDVEIIRTCGSQGQVTVSYATPSGGAEQGVNYRFLDESVTFEEGETSKTVTLQSFESERTIDKMSFYFTLMDVGDASMGMNYSSRILIRDMDNPAILTDAETLLEECSSLNLELYPKEQQKKISELVKQLSVYLENKEIPMKEIFYASSALKNAKEMLTERGIYTEEDPFVMPAGTQVKTVEAELFTLDSSKAQDKENKYVRITENSEASNGQEVNWFENGNRIYLPFEASSVGTYKVTATYRSGRDSGNPNAFEWSGTNITQGSMDVHGDGDQVPFRTAEFNIEVTQKGAGQLVFTASGKGGPVIDKFKIECVDKTVVPQTVEGIVLVEKEVTLTKEKTFVFLNAKVFPEDATNQNIIYESKDASVAKVDKNGVVVAVGNGETVITATTEDGGKKAECKVTVSGIQNKESSTELNNALQDAEKMDLSGYTKESVAVFNKELEDAKKVYENQNATQAELQEAVRKLQSAKLQLVKLPEGGKDEKPNPDIKQIPAAGKTVYSSGVSYKVTKSAAVNGTVSLEKWNKGKQKKVVIPATVVIDGYTFKVTSIADKAFQNNKSLKKVTIGVNVVKIGNKSFYKCKKLSTVIFKNKNAVKAGKHAFKGTASKIKVTVPKKMKAKKLKALKKNLKKAGISKKAVYKKK